MIWVGIFTYTVTLQQVGYMSVCSQWLSTAIVMGCLLSNLLPQFDKRIQSRAKSELAHAMLERPETTSLYVNAGLNVFSSDVLINEDRISVWSTTKKLAGPLCSRLPCSVPPNLLPLTAAVVRARQ
jgi:hypothetical protein